jgi:hypothetical protein
LTKSLQCDGVEEGCDDRRSEDARSPRRGCGVRRTATLWNSRSSGRSLLGLSVAAQGGWRQANEQVSGQWLRRWPCSGEGGRHKVRVWMESWGGGGWTVVADAEGGEGRGHAGGERMASVRTQGRTHGRGKKYERVFSPLRTF